MIALTQVEYHPHTECLPFNRWITGPQNLQAMCEHGSTKRIGQFLHVLSPVLRENAHKDIHMALILASASTIRADMLRRAGVKVEAIPARIDEAAIRDALLAEGALPRDVADALAEGKARKVALRNPGGLVLGCDQVLTLKGQLYEKPSSPEMARAQLIELRGQTHQLLSAAVLYDGGEPVWRHVGVARLAMRSFSDAYLDDYIARNWPAIAESVGAYKLEEEGVRLFAQVTGDYFTILGLPMLELLNYLALRGEIDG